MAGARPNMTLTSAKGMFAARMPCGAGGRVKPPSGMKCKAMKPRGDGAGRHAHD